MIDLRAAFHTVALVVWHPFRLYRLARRVNECAYCGAEPCGRHDAHLTVFAETGFLVPAELDGCVTKTDDGVEVELYAAVQNDA